MISGKSADALYKKACRAVLRGYEAERRGMRTREINPALLSLSNTYKNEITHPLVRTTPYAHAELAWYYSGEQTTAPLGRYAGIWDNYAPEGRANSAYGYQIFNPEAGYAESQWSWARQRLTEDPWTRRALINLNVPAHKEDFKLDFPCTVSLQFLKEKKGLSLFANMRSNDIYLGLRNDLYCFTSMLHRMANELGEKPARYVHYAASLHAYEKDWPRLEEYVKSK